MFTIRYCKKKIFFVGFFIGVTDRAARGPRSARRLESREREVARLTDQLQSAAGSPPAGIPHYSF